MSLLTFRRPLMGLITRSNAAVFLSSQRNLQDYNRNSATNPAKRCLSTQPTDVNHKFYELRTYSIKPKCMAEFVKLTKEKIHPRLTHSKLVGYWISELGGMNEVVHIWEYDNFAHRTAVRAALAEDTVWQESYFQQITKMMWKQDNVILKALPQVPMLTEPHKEGGIYELRCYNMKAVGPAAFVEPLLRVLMPRRNVLEKLGYGKCLGAWITDIGNINAVYHLWSYESMDKRTEARHAVLSSDEITKAEGVSITDMPAHSMHSKVMVPMPFSPLK